MADDPAPQSPQSPPSPPPQDALVVTHHTATVGGQELRYTVTTGTLLLKEEVQKDGVAEGEKPKAAVFFVAYTLEGAEPGVRPLTFSFNGGPGSSSVWLHLGLLGPKRVLMDDEGHPTPPPYRLVDNEFSLLDVTDLVFIDPVSTGYSRAVAGEKPGDFHGFKRDIESVGDFIRLYTSRYGRWLSPKHLIGESYGTTRAAGLSSYLQERHGLYLNGIMLVSSVLDFGTLLAQPGNDLPHALILPSFTATARYHGKLEGELQAKPLAEVLQEAEAFASGDYALALLQGDRLNAERRADVRARLARLTGLSETYLEQADLRVDIMRFAKELLRSEGRTVGRLDSRFTGSDRDAAGETFSYDPAYAAIQGPYTATFNDYVRRDLGFESDLPYEIIANLYETWSYKDFENRYAETGESLRSAMTQNPYLRVHVSSGFFDLATPYFATDYTLAHLGLTAAQRERLSVSTYEAGHMMYVQRASLEKLKTELSGFVISPTAG